MLELYFTGIQTAFKGYDSRIHTHNKTCLRRVFNGMNNITITGATLTELIAAVIKPPSGILLLEVLRMPIFRHVFYSESCINLLLAEYTHPDLPDILNHIIASNRENVRPTDIAPGVPNSIMMSIIKKCGVKVNILECIIDFSRDYMVNDGYIRYDLGVDLESLFVNVFRRFPHVFTAFAFSPQLQVLFNEYLLSILDTGRCSLHLYSPTWGKKIVQDLYTLGHTIEFSDNSTDGQFTVIIPEPPVETPQEMDVEESDVEPVSMADILARISEISSQIQELKSGIIPQ